MSFIKELKRRNVFRVAIAYAIVGWLLVEIASVVLPALLLPDLIFRALVVFVLLGFPLQLVESDSGNSIVVLGIGVIEYTFQKVR